MRTNKKTHLYDLILERLIEGRYRFGERILVRQIADDTGASRQPIMSALGALSIDGFVNIVPQVGCEVINPTMRDVEDFYLMFARTEGLLAELAAARWTTMQLTTLKATNAMIRADLEADGGRQYRELNRLFHRTFHEMASSPLVNARQSSIFAMSDFLIRQTVGFRPHVEGATVEHDAIIAALEARDSQKARETAEWHIQEVAAAVIEAARAGAVS